jgi:hypothetical protein
MTTPVEHLPGSQAVEHGGHEHVASARSGAGTNQRTSTLCCVGICAARARPSRAWRRAWCVPRASASSAASPSRRQPRNERSRQLDKGYDYLDAEIEVVLRRIVPHIRRRRTAHARLRPRKAQALGRRAHHLLAESLPFTADPVGAIGIQLPGPGSPRLRHHSLSAGAV